MVVAITGPGADVLPWNGRTVESRTAFRWNMTASKRFARLMKAAQKAADRRVRAAGWRGTLPRTIARAWAPQKRGVWHVHLALPAETAIERVWSRTVVRFVDAAQRDEGVRLTANERRVLIDLEFWLGAGSRNFYGWGFIDRKAARRLGSVRGELGALKAARYLAENVARYLGENVSASSDATRALPGRAVRSHVSMRLTRITGVTMRNLRRVRYLYVCLTQSLKLPEWPDEVLEVVWRLLSEGVVVAQGP